MSWEEQKRQDRQRRHSPLDRPFPPLSYRRRRGGTASVIGVLFFFGLWLLCAVIPLILMLAAIRWLWLNA